MHNLPKLNTPAIVDCPAHLQEVLQAAEMRWRRKGILDHRIFQASEVLEEASHVCQSRSWGESHNLQLAELGAWLVALAVREDRDRPRPTQPAALILDEDEQAIIAAHRARKGQG